ncbi:MAG: nickel pincer cofactor biosynthesis protein LarC [Thermodesulfatator sp.]|nr:MAG: nickel pincer cofactor biosynthesis protein LarC [Thermodesulfatator sp.]
MDREKDHGEQLLKVAYLDCISGVSGDMLLSALLDVGWDEKRLRELPPLLGLKHTNIQIKRVLRHGLSAVNINIVEKPAASCWRNLDALQGLIADSMLPENVKGQAVDVLTSIARAEAKIHGCKPDEIHFHEIGAVDTIIDITGSLLALWDLEIERVFCSPLPLSRGFVKSSHGMLPVPAPAVVELLKRIPVYPVDETNELVTPTGAAIIQKIAFSFGSVPEMEISAAGYGAGSRDLDSMPNVLRIIVGNRRADELKTEAIVEMKTLIDDMTPEQLGGLMESFFK